jgi:hypothetical protein
MDTTVGWGGDEHRPLDDDDDVADKFRSKVVAFNIVERRRRYTLGIILNDDGGVWREQGSAKCRENGRRGGSI